MTPDEKMKWRAFYFLISLAVGWYVFLLTACGLGYIQLTTLEAVGAGTLGGFLITSSTLVVQFFFRRQKPKE